MRLARIKRLLVRLFKQPWRLAGILGAAALSAWLQQHLPGSGIAGFLSHVACDAVTLLVGGPFILSPPASTRHPAPAPPAAPAQLSAAHPVPPMPGHPHRADRSAST